MDSYTSFMCRC